MFTMVMSKSSVVTVRETPVAKTTSASAGGFAVVAETIDVDTTERIELVDLTDTVMAFVRQSSVQEGLMSLWSMHTTCARVHQRIAAGARCRHQDVPRRHRRARPATTCTTIRTTRTAIAQNADSHLRAMLLGHSVTLQISGGELVRGAAGSACCAASSTARATRTLRAQVWGSLAVDS